LGLEVIHKSTACYIVELDIIWIVNEYSGNISHRLNRDKENKRNIGTAVMQPVLQN